MVRGFARKAVFLSVAALAVACGGQQTQRPQEAAAPPAPKAMTAEERAKWYQDCWDLFSNKSWDAFKGCYADGVESETVDSGQPALKGPDAVVANTKAFADAFPDVKGTPQMVFVNGNTVVGVYAINGTHTGPLPGPGGKAIPATNKKVGYLMAHVIESDPSTNKGIKEAAYADNGTLMAQLGLNPAPARPVMEPIAAAPIVVVSTGSEAEAKNVEVFRASVEAFNKHDLKAVEALNTPDVIFHDMTQPKDMDAKANHAMTMSFFKGFPDAMLTVDSIFGAGDYTVARGTFEATNKGAMPDMGIKKPTNKSVRAHFIEITKYEGGKTKEDWLFFDSMAFASQLGLTAPPAAN